MAKEKDADMAEVFFRAFKSLDRKNRDAFVKKLIKARDYRKEIFELAIADKLSEPKKPLREYIAERKEKVFGRKAGEGAGKKKE